MQDLVDFVTEESERCAQHVCEYLAGQYRALPVANVKYMVPNRYFPGRENRFYLQPLLVKNQARLEVRVGGETVKARRLTHVQPSEMVSFTIKPS